MNVAHTAVWVSDLNETRWFYEDVLGLEYQWEFTADDGTRNYYVGTGDGAEIQFKYRPSDDAGSVTPSGIDHLAVMVEDPDQTFHRVVEESDCAVVHEPMTIEAIDSRVAFVSDPDGYTVEFVQEGNA